MRTRSVVILCGLLLAGAISSGTAAVVAHLRWSNAWRQLSTGEREMLLLGRYEPVVRKVRTQVPPAEGILLVSGIDPAPLPYALFPRRIWQRETDPETSAEFMDLPPSPYPMRDPDTFPVLWGLYLHDGNMEQGGELSPINPGGGNR